MAIVKVKKKEYQVKDIDMDLMLHKETHQEILLLSESHAKISEHSIEVLFLQFFFIQD